MYIDESLEKPKSTKEAISPAKAAKQREKNIKARNRTFRLI
jgi:hypothetical protein